MTAIDPSVGFYGSTVETGNGISSDGMVNFGGVSVSAAEAAHFVMMHRTVVMKEVGADRTEMAQQQLEKIRTARQILIDLGDLKEFIDTGKSYRDRAPVTPAMIDFLKNEVGCTPGEFTQRLLVWGSAVPKLPESVRKHYGMFLDRFGVYQPYGSGGMFNVRPDNGSNRYSLNPITCVNGDGLDTLKAQVNNYIDQLNDSNNLFMTKFKNVVNNMNTALEGANNLADKTHDMAKNLASRW